MSEADVTIRQFFKHLYEAVTYMESFPELAAQRSSLEDHISNGMDVFLARGLMMDESLKSLLIHRSKDIRYLCDFLIFGLLVQEGDNLSSAYTKTLSKYDTWVERLLIKLLMKDKYFRKMNDYEIKNINTIRELLKE